MTESLPAWAVEEVRLVAPDPAWSEQGARAATVLHDRLRPWLAGPVEHIGSTAVPGLLAKPILDLVGPVWELDRAEEVRDALQPFGWHYVPPALDRRPDRRFFIQVVDGHRAMHLHLVLPESAGYRDEIAFRDALRSDPAVRTAYADLKTRLATEHSADREAYTEGKAEFIREVLASRA